MHLCTSELSCWMGDKYDCERIKRFSLNKSMHGIAIIFWIILCCQNALAQPSEKKRHSLGTSLIRHLLSDQNIFVLLSTTTFRPALVPYDRSRTHVSKPLICEHKVAVRTVSTTEALHKSFSSAPNRYTHSFSTTARSRGTIIQVACHFAVCSIEKELGHLAIRVRDASNAAIVARVLGELNVVLKGRWAVTFASKIVA